MSLISTNDVMPVEDNFRYRPPNQTAIPVPRSSYPNQRMGGWARPQNPHSTGPIQIGPNVQQLYQAYLKKQPRPAPRPPTYQWRPSISGADYGKQINRLPNPVVTSGA